MSKGKFKLNLPGLNKLMRGEEMQAVLSAHGATVLNKAQSMAITRNAEYSMETIPLRWIAVTTVRAENGAAVHDNYEHNTLLKALGGGS